MATNNNKKRLNDKNKKTTTGSMAGNSYSEAIANKSNSNSGSSVIGTTGFVSPSQSIQNALKNYAKTGAASAGSAATGNSLSYLGNVSNASNAGSAGSMVGNSYSAAIADALNKVNSAPSLPETPTLPSITPELEQEIQQSVSLPSSMPTLSEIPSFNSEYLDQLNALANKLTKMNYEDWTQGDQYKTLANRYGDMGKMSMQDVLGQIAGRTGGLASSYATSAAQQQYNDYMTQLEDVARSLYSSDRNDLMNDFSTLRSLYSDEYDRYRDTAEDEYQRYRDQVSDYMNMLTLQNRLASSSGSSGGSGTSGSSSTSGAASPGTVEKFTPSYALQLATKKADSTNGQILALQAMRDAGNITQQEYSNLVYALKYPGK